jgi:hypothetical protein
MVQWLTATPVSEQERHLFEAFSLMFPAYARNAMTAVITSMHGRKANFGAILKIDV